MPGSSLDLGALPSLDDVEFVEKLGEGLGAGRFKARLSGGESVALLLEDTTLIDHDRFAAWGRALSAVDHQGLPRVVRVEDALQPAFVAFAYVDGQNLEARLALRGEGLVELDALSVVLQAAAAVRAAHRVGVAHGELDPRSIVLVDRPGGLDGVAVVGWTPPGTADDFEALARADLKALGSLLYVALTGVAPPSSHRLEGLDALEGGGGAFDDILMDWVDVERDLGGLGRPALDALADSGRYADVPAFIDALLPHFRAKVEAHLEHAARDLDADRTFMAEVERQRARLRELEARQRAVRDWLHGHARRIERCDAELDRLRERVAALQSIETEMGLLAGQAARPAARLPDRFERFDPRGAWSAPPEPEQAFEPTYDRRGLDRVSRIGSRPPSGRFDRRDLSAPPPPDEPAPREAGAEPVEPETPPPAEPTDPVDAAGADEPVVPERPDAPEATPEPARRAADALDPVAPPASGALVGALGVAVVLGVLGAAWLLAGTDGGPAPEPAPEPPTRSEAPAPAAAAPVEAPPKADPTVNAAPVEAPAVDVPVAAAPDGGPADGDPEGIETFEPVDVREADLGPTPAGMVRVPAGLVRPGLADDRRAAALAQCRVDLKDYPAAWCADRLAPTIEPPAAGRPVGPLFADRLEVSQAAYARCVAEGACEALRLHWDLPEQPATGVTRDMAAAYCRWRGGRLPTADEWLYAARGGDDRLFPWGDEPPGAGADARANYGRFTHKGGLPDRDDLNKYAAPVEAFAGRGESPFGALNMAGNVREWTTNEVEGRGVTMGGGWREAPFELRVTRREPAALDTARNDLGFRCVADPGAGEERK